jgi:hypothetical protein
MSVYLTKERKVPFVPAKVYQISKCILYGVTI